MCEPVRFCTRLPSPQNVKTGPLYGTLTCSLPKEALSTWGVASCSWDHEKHLLTSLPLARTCTNLLVCKSYTGGYCSLLVLVFNPIKQGPRSSWLLSA
jgi:hypothetical protein